MDERVDNDELLERAGRGDAQARADLLARHRERLRRMVALRMDRRLSPRVDPSDVVQDALAEAHRQLPDYLLERPLPFYPWLRQIAWDRLVQQHRRHLHAGRRSVRREEERRSPTLGTAPARAVRPGRPATRRAAGSTTGPFRPACQGTRTAGGLPRRRG